VQNLLLGATALGLGSALTTLAMTRRDDVRWLLGLPEHVEPVALVPIGRPARALGAPRREPAADHAHRDRYGTRW
jgi:nitroreductase